MSNDPYKKVNEAINRMIEKAVEFEHACREQREQEQATPAGQLALFTNDNIAA